MLKINIKDLGIVTIRFQDGLDEATITKIDSIISKNYDKNCEYIDRINMNIYSIALKDLIYEQ